MRIEGFAEFPMKGRFCLLLVLVAGITPLATGAVDGDSCLRSSEKCTAKFSSFSAIEPNLNAYTRQMVDKSFDFIILGSVFDKYNMYRPGLHKMYRKISDKAWEDSIELMRYISKRGGSVDLGSGVTNSTRYSTLLRSTEKSSLEEALDYEKKLAEEAHLMHKKISHPNFNPMMDSGKKGYDPDVAHFLDEKLIRYQSETIRKLAGYNTNLKDLEGEGITRELAIQLFDEYLDKVE